MLSGLDSDSAAAERLQAGVFGGRLTKLWACACAGAAKELAETASASESGPSAAEWGGIWQAAAAAMMRYSGARLGDRTMLDSLCPAADIFANSVRRGAALDTP